jgi:REP element-mobilizing transposase RayT
MPNHLHGILILNGDPINTGGAGDTGTPRSAQGACHVMPVQPPRRAAFGQPIPASLATILGLFKQAVTRRVESSLAAATAESLESSTSPSSYGHATACPQGMPWHARTTRDHPHIWHENYYEHIIRNEKELERIREYICTNPLRWPYDVENPACESEAADDIEELLAADDDEL